MKLPEQKQEKAAKEARAALQDGLRRDVITELGRRWRRRSSSGRLHGHE